MSEERTQPATPRRREEARAEGRVARSADLTAAAGLLAGVLALHLLGLGGIAGYMRTALGALESADPGAAFAAFAAAAAPVLAIVLAAAAAAGLAQSGFLFTLRPLAPRIERLAPSGDRLMSAPDALAGLLKVAAVGAVLACTLWSERALILGAERPLQAMASMAFTVALRAALVLGALGLADYAWRRRRHEESLRMTPEEAREEMRRYEGAPEVRERRRAAQRRLAVERMMHRLPRAAVVISGPDLAVAVEVDAAAPAPRVAAKGARAVARTILERAADHGVPVVENGEAAAALYRRAEVGGAVPADQYRAVAEAVALAAAVKGRTVTA